MPLPRLLPAPQAPLRDGGQKRWPGREAIWTQKIIDGIFRSAKAGREVRIV